MGALLQITGRLIEHFLGEGFLKYHDQAASVLDLLLHLSENLLSKSQTEADIELLSQAVSCMRPFQHWLRLGFFRHKPILPIEYEL